MPYTLVTFHAHPDDEAITTAGTMARAKAEGHRVVLVVATKGELSTDGSEVLAPGETLAERRVAETTAAAKEIGVDRLEFLGYHDSGMEGAEADQPPGCFAQADVAEAADRLAAILSEEAADVLTVYDERGNYGHPDHIQVHVVGYEAAKRASTPRVVEATANRDHFKRLMRLMPDALVPEGVEDVPTEDDIDSLGVPEDQISLTVDVREYIEQKRAAMAAHASQIPEDSFFLQMPPDAFREAWGYEFYIVRDAPKGTKQTDIFEGLS